MERGMSVFLVRESCDVQCDGVAGAVATRDEALAANRAADRDGAHGARHFTECQRMKLAFDTPFTSALLLLRLMRERTFERGDSDRRVAKFSALRERCRERQPIVV